VPTYEFRCPTGHDFERFFKTISTAPSEVECPECGALAARQLSGGAGLVFKGSGFYLTDYGKNAHRGSAPDKKGDGGKPDAAKSEAAKSDGGGSGGSGEGAGSGGSGGSGGGEGGGKSGASKPGGGESAAPKAESKAERVKPKGESSQSKSGSKPKSE
jgi:putative FmdB family regulatory protein